MHTYQTKHENSPPPSTIQNIEYFVLKTVFEIKDSVKGSRSLYCEAEHTSGAARSRAEREQARNLVRVWSGLFGN